DEPSPEAAAHSGPHRRRRARPARHPHPDVPVMPRPVRRAARVAGTGRVLLAGPARRVPGPRGEQEKGQAVMIDTDRVRVTTVIRTDPATAFHVFTAEIDSWWK